MWDKGENPEQRMLLARERFGSLSRAERQALCNELMKIDSVRQDSIEVLAPASGAKLLELLVNTPGAAEVLGDLIGRCGSSCRTDTSGCYNRRLSVFEEERLRANLGGAIDIPTLDGAGGTTTVTIPAYNTPWYLSQFSMDGEISVNTGSINKVNVLVSHAGIVLAEFRVSQYYKTSCCTTIVEQFRRHKLCLGWASTLTITVTNNNLLAAEKFVNGVFSFARGYPDPITGF